MRRTATVDEDRCGNVLLRGGCDFGASRVARRFEFRFGAGARNATLDQIDDFRNHCGDSRRVEDWLKEVAGDTAKSIKWSGGRCTLTNKRNPLDAGTNWCGQAVIAPKRGKDAAAIEVFFEKPAHGKPGTPFAFRAVAPTKDGPDYMRETYGFEVNWKQMYLPGYQPPANQDCDELGR